MHVFPARLHFNSALNAAHGYCCLAPQQQSGRTRVAVTAFRMHLAVTSMASSIAMQVQVLVHVRAAGGVPIAPPHYELLECAPDTTVLDLKKQARD